MDTLRGMEALAAYLNLRDRDLLAEGLVVAEGRLVASRLAAAARATAEPCVTAETGRTNETCRTAPPIWPRPRFSLEVLACVPSLAAELEPLAAGLCPLTVVPEAVLSRLAGYPFHRGALGIGRRLPSPDALEAELSEALERAVRRGGPSRLLVLPSTTDPENLGAMVRTAAALGYEAVLAGPDTADPLSRRALRVSMGAALSLPFLRVGGPSVLGLLAGAGYEVAAAVLDTQAQDLAAWRPGTSLALLIGNEYEGLRPEWLAPPDGRCRPTRLTIAMEGGADSLNAAAAAAIFMFAGRGG